MSQADGGVAPRIDFRPMSADDLPMVEAWLRAEHTQPWWSYATDHEEIVQAARGEVPVEQWILRIDGSDAGYFQLYDVAYDDEYRTVCASVGVAPGTAGIDYLIGEPSLIGGGIGTRAIATFVGDVVFGRGDWPAVSAGPDPANGASIRVLEKNGFRVAGDVDTSWGPERLMLLTRATWEDSRRADGD
jgi:aminoglycoside 6'-N-acetyltransferase